MPKGSKKKRPTKVVKKLAPKRSTTPIDGIIDRLGGNREVAQLLGVSVTAVANYRAFGIFPASSYFVLRDAMEAEGLPVKEKLWNMRPRAA